MKKHSYSRNRMWKKLRTLKNPQVENSCVTLDNIIQSENTGYKLFIWTAKPSTVLCSLLQRLLSHDLNSNESRGKKQLKIVISSYPPSYTLMMTFDVDGSLDVFFYIHGLLVCHSDTSQSIPWQALDECPQTVEVVFGLPMARPIKF